MSKENARQNLISILQNAYSGELAAAYAYRGHWRSLKKSAAERERIRQIEDEEWTHRREVGKWLAVLEAKPRKVKEAILWTIGRSLGAACHVSGWFFPMYFAGRLESGNVKEYEEAAAFANELEMPECCKELMEMARVEQEHEDFFRSVVARHRLLPLTRKIFRWS
jgi:demethoxyubiquinone hydroxylase (CLK1/Coq7/Cat5 family)